MKKLYFILILLFFVANINATNSRFFGMVCYDVLGGGLSGLSAARSSGAGIWFGTPAAKPQVATITQGLTPAEITVSKTDITSDVNLPSPINANTQNNVTPFKGYIRNGNTGIDGGKSLSTSSLNPTHYITKSKTAMQTLMNDIRENGIQESIKYVEHNGVKYIVDGHHRFYAAQRLGIQSIPVQQVQLPYGLYKGVMDLMMEPGKQPGFWKFIK
jgi:hypothetical protein